MLRVLIVLLTVRNCLSVDYPYPKCCDSDSVLVKSDAAYNCTQDNNKRVQIVTNRTNFLNSSEEGFCIDVETSVSLFRITESKLTKVKNLQDINFFLKCCPLNYVYNSTSHGCIKSQDTLEIFFEESFVKVGLPQCKVIVDLPVNVHNHVMQLNDTYFLTTNRKIQPGLYCADKDQNNKVVVRICYDDYDVCDRMRCIRKCCPDGQSFVNGSFCRNTFVHGLDFSSFSGNMDNINDTFAVIHDGYNPPIYPLIPQRFHFYLSATGIFAMSEFDEKLKKFNVTRHYGVEEKVYCIEHAVKEATNTNSYLFFRGFPQQKSIKFTYAGIAMAISCFFLVLTILYYCLSDEKKTLFGKILISYCTASLFTLLLLSYFGLNLTRPSKGSTICDVIAFVILYLTLAIITWMNVMCVDIYCTFGSSKSFLSRQVKRKELKRFLLYSLHGWGTPFILMAISLTLYHVDVLPLSLKIIVREDTCFFYRGEGNYAQLLFSTTPFAVLQICNLVLFIKTAVYCWQVKKEIDKINDTQLMKGEKKQKFNKFRDRFGLLLKLFFIMGISFLFEVLSTFYDFKTTDTTAIIEIIWDTFNCLQGVFIFVIFILKRRIFKKFKKNVGLKKLRKISLVSSAMTQTTSIPVLSK